MNIVNIIISENKTKNLNKIYIAIPNKNCLGRIFINLN